MKKRTSVDCEDLDAVVEAVGDKHASEGRVCSVVTRNANGALELSPPPPLPAKLVKKPAVRREHLRNTASQLQLGAAFQQRMFEILDCSNEHECELGGRR